VLFPDGSVVGDELVAGIEVAGACDEVVAACDKGMGDVVAACDKGVADVVAATAVRMSNLHTGHVQFVANHIFN
jgi:hypothetical protein